MAHAGTMDLGKNAQAKQKGSRWPAIALAAAVAVATIAGVWLASSAGLVGGTAKPAADRIEAQTGAATLSSDAYLNGILDRAHAAPYAAVVGQQPNDLSVRRGYATEAQPGIVTRDRVGGP